jgi:D-beta-D-heptose 7-phosphate kinase/D-beta-D-heptose 1-phosphate adenosyltransferase
MNEYQTIQPHKQLKIVLIGDNCIDEYQYGTVDRLSPEAPVPVFRDKHLITKPGMAANVQANLEALGCQVTAYLSMPSVKTRLIDLRSNQHIVRIDRDQESEPLILADLDLSEYDAVVISDYNKGFVTYELVEQIIQSTSLPVFIDTKKIDLVRFEGAVVKINSLENGLAKTFPTELIVTMGKHGAKYKGRQYPAVDIDVVDVCGAGDTFLAALVFGYLMEGDMSTAIAFAVQAGAVTVQHTGVYAPTLEEIVCV